MFGWLKKKATKLQVSNTKRDLKILIDALSWCTQSAIMVFSLFYAN